jgi:hypothetical protein
LLLAAGSLYHASDLSKQQKNAAGRHPADLALLQNAQQLVLHDNRDVTNFIEQQRASIGGSQQSLPVVYGAGKGCAPVAKELGAQERFRKTRAS